MSVGIIVTIALVLFLVLLLSSMPVAFSLAASGGLGIILLMGLERATSTVGNTAFNAPFDYSLSVVPMYILLGMLAMHGKLSLRIFKVAASALKYLPGGLGVATVAACAGFSAVSGSSLATAASLGKISVAEMRSYGYRPSFAAGIVATAGTLGVLIPPSVLLVLYAVLAEESIGEILAAGIIPGILSFVLVSAYVMSLSRKNVINESKQDLQAAISDAAWQRTKNSSTSRSMSSPQEFIEEHDKSSAQEPVGSQTTTLLKETSERDPNEHAGNDINDDSTVFPLIRAVLWILAIFSVILLGTFTGLFTIVQSAGIGAVVALVMLLVEVGSAGAKETLIRLFRSLLDTAATTSMAFGLMIGAGIFSVFLVLSGVPRGIASWVGEMPWPPLLIVAALLAMLIPLGMFLDSFAIIIILAPLVHPIVVQLGFEGVWFAVIFILMIEVGMITPPVGLNAFVVASATSVPLEDTFKGLFGFVVVMLAFAGFLLLVPEVVMWLPNMVR